MSRDRKDDKIDNARAGSTSESSGNLPAISYSVDASYQPYIESLFDKGFIDACTGEAGYLLERVSIYHLSPYLNVISRCDCEKTIKAAHDLMVFDRQMQAVLLRFIGIVETQLRAQYSHKMTTYRGDFSIYDQRSYLHVEEYKKSREFFMREIERHAARNRRIAKTLQDNDGMLPVMQAVECISFGTLSKLYDNTKSSEVTKGVAASFDVSKRELSSWIKTVSNVRNICAHFDAYIVRKHIPSTPLPIKDLSFSNRSTFYLVLLHTGMTMKDLALCYDYALWREAGAIIKGFSDAYPSVCSSIGIPVDWSNLMNEVSDNHIEACRRVFAKHGYGPLREGPQQKDGHR